MPAITNLDALLHWWEGQRGDTPLPPHSAIRPEMLRPWLANLAVLEVHRGAKRFYYRLAGTMLATRYGIDFTGRWLEDLRIRGSIGYWEQQYATVASTRLPLGGSVAHFDPDLNQKVCTWLMLPFAPDLPPRGGPGPLDLVILSCVQFTKA